MHQWSVMYHAPVVSHVPCTSGQPCTMHQWSVMYHAPAVSGKVMRALPSVHDPHTMHSFMYVHTYHTLHTHAHAHTTHTHAHTHTQHTHTLAHTHTHTVQCTSCTQHIDALCSTHTCVHTCMQHTHTTHTYSTHTTHTYNTHTTHTYNTHTHALKYTCMVCSHTVLCVFICCQYAKWIFDSLNFAPCVCAYVERMDALWLRFFLLPISLSGHNTAALSLYPGRAVCVPFNAHHRWPPQGSQC